MATLPPDPGKHQTIPPTLSNTMPTPMATVIVHRNGVPTAIQVPATGIIRQPHPSSSENDSSDTTDSPVDPPLTARQLRSKRAADTFLARHDRTRNPRPAPRTRHTHKNPRPTRPDTPGSAPDGLSEDDRPIRARQPRKPNTTYHPGQAQSLQSRPTLPSAPTLTPVQPSRSAKGSSTQSSLPDIWRRSPPTTLAPHPITLPTPTSYITTPISAPITHCHGPPQATIPAIPTLGTSHLPQTSHKATASSSQQTRSSTIHTPPCECNPYSHTQLTAPWPAPSDVQPTTTPAPAPGPACPAPATPPPTITSPHVTLWNTTYPPQADYRSPSQDTSLGSLVPIHRDIPLHNAIAGALGTLRLTALNMQHPEPIPTQSTTHPTFEDISAPTPPGPAHTHPFPHTGSSSHPTRPPPEVADTTIDDDDQEEYDANTALQFPGIRNLHDEGQPILYRTMQRYWEREAHLFQGFTADDIADIERHFADAKVRIQFSIYPSLQPPNDQLSIINYRREIEDVCQERFGLTFRGGLLEHGQQLLGDPLQRTIQAWAAPRRGYLFLRDISVVMIYQYAGVLDNGLSFHQLEYRNPSKTSPGDLMCALRALGATDAIVQSHTRMSGTHGPRDHLAAIGCIKWPSEGHYRFRLVFPSQSMAETVYANFRQHMAGPDRLDLVPPSMKLTPLRDLCWDNPTSTFFHPHATSAATLVDTKVRIGRLPPLTTTDDILAALRGSHLPTPDVDITGDDYVTLTFDTPAPIAFLWSTSGPHGETRLYIRDIAVHLHILTGRPRRSAAPLQCRDCGRHDHQGRPCDRFTYLDPRDRARSNSQHTTTTRRDLSSTDTRTRSASRHRHAGHHSHSALQHPAAEGQHQQHQPQTQAWQLPLQRHPQQVHGHTTDLNLYLRREISTYVDQRIVSATTPLRQEVESLRADKEALVALVSASSAAFSTLDARLLEERRLREAAELLQAEDNRLSAEAHIRLNTVVTQHESQQAALTARLPYLESSVHTLLQAMQSVSSQMSALAGLGPLPATLTPNDKNQTTPWALSFRTRGRQTNPGVLGQTNDTSATPLVWTVVAPQLSALDLLLLPPGRCHPLSITDITPTTIYPHTAPAFSHLHDPYSSDDSNNSELLDARIAEALQTPLPLSTPDINPPRQRRRRRAWRIHRLPLPPPDADTARHQLDNILRRESLKGEAYIGDPGQPPPPGLLLDSLRIAATNINKNTYGKLGDELATWFRANALDFLIIADSDLPAHKATHLWTSTPSGSPTPHLMAVSNHRVSVLYDIQRWHSRIDARRTTYSPSGRSISICIRLGKGSLLTLIGTYCQDSPASHRETTEQEWQWLTQATTKIPGHHHSVIMGGDFNTYGTNPLDRSAPQLRTGPSLGIGTPTDNVTPCLHVGGVP
ncbi:hypothetical protein H257_13454 [Aphanomyces astaci]|uniref:Endonuclease/exonuclease/phosphatase domain-containing protein n=1 Tax=Aphanomyces astaci TaxID=112090 RepID=W4FV06_APHAT|nr:hypothetical protein H257_13454 [Aphanomyces astaci]ETV71327.1 hypothetical protein H257_13454 [Aphanomyces astaci]|eukprot:XP_009839267.1 hypothetical protein H257_13454 [Aphanomyces astaci]